MGNQKFTVLIYKTRTEFLKTHGPDRGKRKMLRMLAKAKNNNLQMWVILNGNQTVKEIHFYFKLKELLKYKIHRANKK